MCILAKKGRCVYIYVWGGGGKIKLGMVSSTVVLTTHTLANSQCLHSESVADLLNITMHNVTYKWFQKVGSSGQFYGVMMMSPAHG